MPNPVQVQGRSPEEIKLAEEKKKKEEEKKKKEKKNPQKPQPRYYDIKLECMVPCTITYRVLAENEQDALIKMDRQMHTNIKPNVSKKRNMRATVYDAGSSIIRFIKSFKV